MLESPPEARGAATRRRGLAGPAIDLLSRGRDALRPAHREFLKFGVIGGVAFVVDITIYQILVHFGNDPVLESRPVTARIIAAAVATVVAWLGNRYWTFRRRRRSEIHREAVLFAVMNAIGIGISAACLGISRYGLDLSSPLADYVASYGFGTVLGMAFRFTAYRYVVFRGDREGDDATPPPAAPPTSAVYRSPAPTSFGPHIIPGSLPD